MSKLQLTLVFGGQSTEYKISLMSASFIASCLEAIPEYELHYLGITQQGEFFAFTGERAQIADDTWHKSAQSKAVLFAPSPQRAGYYVREATGELSFVPVDCFFPALHGRRGEDGCLQGLFELLNVPYVGCGVLASAVLMDKDLMRKVFAFGSIEQTQWRTIQWQQYKREGSALIDRLLPEAHFPYFVKPANAGSSVGISQVKSREQWAAALELAATVDEKILIEDAVRAARELECSILQPASGAPELVLSPIGEIIAAHEFYDYESKYEDANSKLCYPVDLPPEIELKIKEYARLAFQLVGARGLARADFFYLPQEGRVLINELNTMPGFTQISMYPLLLQAAGIPGTELMRTLVDNALNR